MEKTKQRRDIRIYIYIYKGDKLGPFLEFLRAKQLFPTSSGG